MIKIRFNKGFTLVELLVVIAVISILLGLSIFGLRGARTGSRDARRKADLESMRSGLEMYKADCNRYPATITLGGTLVGTGGTTPCPTTNIYIQSVPNDPLRSGTEGPQYSYEFLTTNSYCMHALLEGGPPSGYVRPAACSSSRSCSSDTCNYAITNP